MRFVTNAQLDLGAFTDGRCVVQIFNFPPRSGTPPIEFEQNIARHLESAKKLNPTARLNQMKQVLQGYQQVLKGFQVREGSRLEEVVRANQIEFPEVTTLTNWFNGLWLEHYVLAELAKCKDVKWNDRGLSTNLRVISTKKAPASELGNRDETTQYDNEDGRDFQADIAALRGYQLYYFSCFAGEDKTITKLKLFEAMIRAEQLGGEEARAAVISSVDDYDSLRQQAETEWERGRTRGQFEVFGRKHLSNLAEYISEWVNR